MSKIPILIPDGFDPKLYRSPSSIEINQEVELDRYVRSVREYHPHLQEACIRVVWRTDKNDDFLGTLKGTSHEIWYLTGADLILVGNRSLWDRLSADQRVGLVDHLASTVSDEVDVKRGGGGVSRLVYKKRDLGIFNVDPLVVARNPLFFESSTSGRNLSRAFKEPEQLLIFAEAKKSGDAEEAQRLRDALLPPGAGIESVTLSTGDKSVTLTREGAGSTLEDDGEGAEMEN